jgi:flagellar hook-associated protein 1 FlgK
MSLTGALNAAGNGLASSQTLSQVAADNVANAMTPGFVRRRGILVSPGIGQGGAMVAEIRREVDASLNRMSRLENGKMMRQQAIYESLQNYTIYLGQPGDGTSPAEKFSAFNTSLTTLVNLPSSTNAQLGAVLASDDLSSAIRGANGNLANVRADVDMEIRYEVADLNQNLYDLVALNQRTRDFRPGTFEAAQFGDQIDKVLDQIADIVDIRITSGVDGAVNVYTTGGGSLLEGNRVYDITYNPGDGSFFAGAQDITPGKTGVHGVDQGSLAGFAELKRDIIPRFQLQLDEYARGLIQAFEGSDASLVPGQAGLFTDAGLSYDPTRLEGLAGRIAINDAVRQEAGGQGWRIRDGLGATSEGPTADATQVQAFIGSLSQALNADPLTGIGSTVTVAEYAAEFVSTQSSERARAESSFNAARSAAEVVAASRQNSEGTNIDEEMMRLQMIQQSYAANSKVLTTVSEMLDMLLLAV